MFENTLKIFILLIFTCCSLNKKLPADIHKCDYCKKLLADSFYVDYPLRAIDKNTEGIPLIPIEEIDKDYRDTFRVLTNEEKSVIGNNLYCLLGMKEDDFLKCFHPELIDTIPIFESLETKMFDLHYNIGNYVEKRATYTPVKEANENTEFWLRRVGFSFLYFKKEGDHYIFSGNRQDSIKLKNCIEGR